MIQMEVERPPKVLLLLLHLLLQVPDCCWDGTSVAGILVQHSLHPACGLNFSAAAAAAAGDSTLGTADW